VGVYPLNKIKTVIIAVTLVAFVAVGVLFKLEHNKTVSYESYLSDVLSNRVSSLISSASNVDRVLTEVIKSRALSKNQASSLYGNFNNMKSQTENIIDLSVRLNKIPRNRNVNVVITNAKISDYFKLLNESMELEAVDPLTEAQIEVFKEFQSLVGLYKEIARSNVLGVTETGVNGEYWNNYFKDGIAEDFWIDMINGLEDVTPDYRSFALLTY
jgi:hypothetical protein